MKKNYILIVNYDAATRNLTTKFLNHYGYKTIYINNGTEALNIVRDRYKEIGLILLDITLPDISGFSVLNTIKSNEKFRHIPVIIMTVRTFEEDLKKAMDLGANDVLNLPFEIDNLLKCVNDNILLH